MGLSGFLFTIIITLRKKEEKHDDKAEFQRTY